jgi:hypothetical protein
MGNAHRAERAPDVAGGIGDHHRAAREVIAQNIADGAGRMAPAVSD